MVQTNDATQFSVVKELLTQIEAAVVLCTSAKTLRRYPNQFPHPAKVVGRRKKYRRTELLEWIKNDSLSNAG